MELNMESRITSKESGLFGTPQKETDVESTSLVNITPRSTSDGAIDFDISGNTLQYIDLHRTILCVKAKTIQN